MRVEVAALALCALLGCKREAAAPSPMLAPERAKILPADRVVALVGARPGMVVADLGAGPGYLTLPLARAVQPGGRVIATDTDAAALAALRARAGDLPIETRLVPPDDPGLAPSSVDLALLVHVDSFLPDRARWLERLRPALRPGARLAVINYTPYRAALLADAARAGYDLLSEDDSLPTQYLVLLAPRTSR